MYFDIIMPPVKTKKSRVIGKILNDLFPSDWFTFFWFSLSNLPLSAEMTAKSVNTYPKNMIAKMLFSAVCYMNGCKLWSL
jgi:hypothetical protein